MQVYAKLFPFFLAIFTSFWLLPAPHSRAYEIDRHFQANHCEFYVDVFGLGEFMHGTDTFQSIDIDLRVNLHDLTEQKDVILAAGAQILKKSFEARLDRHGQAVLVVSEHMVHLPMSDNLETGIYKLRHSFAHLTEAVSSYDEIRGLAFYIDVRRADGSVVRLWQSHVGRLFTMQEIFGEAPAFEQSVGTGVIHYPARTSPVYHQRSACAR